MEYQKKFIINSGGIYTRVTFPEMILLQEITSLKCLVDEEGQLLSTAVGNVLPVDRSYHHLSSSSIRKKIRRRQAYSGNNVICHILSMCQNCTLCKNNVVIDSGTTSKIKRAFTDGITKEYKDELMKKQITGKQY